MAIDPVNSELNDRPLWRSAGLHLTHRLDNGWLAVSPDFLRAYFTRPEVHPIDESCAAEHGLFEKLMERPEAVVEDSELAAIADPDTAENYRLVLRFRDHLLRHGSLEAGYRGLFEAGAPIVPPVFHEQLVHVILANLLAGETDPYVARSAELFFRDQLATTENAQLLLADAEVVEMHSETGIVGGLGGLLTSAGTPMRQVSLDVMSESNKDQYRDRSDRFDFVLDFRFAEPGQDAFGRVIERWIAHFFGTPVRVQAMQSIRDDRWSWHIGLDAEATAILNALYLGEPVDDARLARMAALFRLEFLDQDSVVETMWGKPAYLGLAVDARNRVRVKPQNLLTNLPLRPPIQ